MNTLIVTVSEHITKDAASGSINLSIEPGGVIAVVNDEEARPVERVIPVPEIGVVMLVTRRLCGVKGYELHLLSALEWQG
jgi:hypothetical protein